MNRSSVLESATSCLSSHSASSAGTAWDRRAGLLEPDVSGGCFPLLKLGATALELLVSKRDGEPGADGGANQSRSKSFVPVDADPRAIPSVSGS
jgi:hypothetical protein